MDALYFTPYAWSKLCHLQEKQEYEVSFFAVSRRDRLNLVVDLYMPKQIGMYATTEFVDDALPTFFEEMVDKGFHPEEFGRIWCHTHPMDSATPSTKDETTFRDEFNGPNWAIMFIVGKSGNTTCRLRYKPHPDLAHILKEHGTKELPVYVDWVADYPGVTPEVRAAWDAEYEKNFSTKTFTPMNQYRSFPGYLGYNRFGDDDVVSYPTKKDSWKPGPGYRINQSGNWVYQIQWKEFDESCGIANADDYARRYGAGCPVDHGQQGFLTSCYSGLTKRERKYLKKHCTLKGFVTPINPGFKKLEKTDLELADLSDEEWVNQVCEEWEVNQRKLDEEDPKAKLWTVVLSDGTRIYNVRSCSKDTAMDYVDTDNYINCPKNLVPDESAYYAFEQEKILEEEKYTVTLENGTVVKNVPGYDEHDAIQRVHVKLHLPDYFPEGEEAANVSTDDRTSLELSPDNGACNSSLDVEDSFYVL